MKESYYMIFKSYFNKDANKAQFFAEKFNLSPFIMELILSRTGADEQKIAEYLHPTKALSAFDLKGVKQFCERIELAQKMGDKIVIFGDYDVDGVSATAIMLKALKRKNIEANYYLPNRYIDGYGLTKDTVDKVIGKYNPNLIITVDCGISCYEEVEYAKEKGVEVIVTDHHELPEILPDTLVINAKIPNQDFGFDGLCGAGLAYKLAEALLGEKEAEDLLPIAAIATIADIVPLMSENRRVVTKGLKLFEHHLPAGIKALLKENKVSISSPSASAISFKIAPKINASGRMGDAADSLKLYLETDPVKIKKLLVKIGEHNTKRQNLCNSIYEDAISALEKTKMKDVRVITLASKKWDQGVLGIVCSRLVEKYHRPVFLFSQEGDILKGSGRSIDDINIHALLSSMSDILETYGGHSMAAGVTIKRSQYEEFSKRVNAFAFAHVNDEVFIPIKYYDAELSLSQINQNLLDELKLLEPCGCGNLAPKFKITTSELSFTPMKRFPEHAEIKIGDFPLLMFNYTPFAKAMRFSRQKSFIFEFQEGERKGIVSEFDGGSFINQDANGYVFPFEVEQLKYDKTTTASYTIYQPQSLLNHVTQASATVFGTAFVAFSGYDYVSFAKTYSNQGIYYYGIADKTCAGYNSLLLSPQGVDWAKNYNKIVFLSPILEEGYIAELNKVSSAQIFVPTSEKLPYRYNSLNLSRENFGKIYSALASKQNTLFVDEFDIFDKLFASRNIKFLDYFVALKVFEELGLAKIESERGLMKISADKTVKKSLTESKIYSKLSLIKNMLKENQ